jgi:hypothetical protein
MQFDLLILVIFFIWLIGITVILVFQSNFFRKLSNGVDKENLIKVLEKALEQEKINTLTISEIKKEIARIDDAGKFHIQKIGIIRFNPFKELGGDHSFSVALLDGEETGFLITGLHTRERTRVYLKDIKRGKSEVELSDDEKKALNKALH